MNIHELIDQFVKVVDPSASLFRRIDTAPWINAVEEALAKRLPVSYHSLVSRYSFPAFDAGGIHFFANTGHQSHEEWAVAVFSDPIISKVIHAGGFIQLARPEDGSYDPVCFDARKSASNREYAIVRLNHEDILCRGHVGSLAPIAESFYRFAAGVVERS